LLKAGLQNAKGVFSITGDDNSNLVITFTVKQFNPAIKVVSRCRDLKHVDKLKKAGADSVISTRLIGGLRMVSEMVRPTVVTFLDTMLRDKEQSLRIEEIDISDKFINKTIAETGIKSNKKAVLLALKKGNDWIFNPSDKEVLDKGSTFILMVTPEQRIELIQELS
jgi:voltage-gated potassium channel